MDRMMKRRMAAGAAALALLAGGGVLAGCGSSDSSSGSSTTATAAADTTAQQSNGIENLSAQQILDKAMAAAKSATSVKVVGNIDTGNGSASIDMQAGDDAATGTVSGKGIDMQVLVVGGKSYFKLSGAALAQAAGAGSDPDTIKALTSLIGNKWLVVPSDGSAGQLSSLKDLGDKKALIDQTLSPDGTLTVKGTGDVDGQSVVFVDSSAGGTLAVATTGTPYPVQITGGDSKASGKITFSDWNAPVNVTAPTDVLDLAALAKLGDASS